jgi:hypothetical protein
MVLPGARVKQGDSFGLLRYQAGRDARRRISGSVVDHAQFHVAVALVLCRFDGLLQIGRRVKARHDDGDGGIGHDGRSLENQPPRPVVTVPRMRTERALSLDACFVTFASVIISTTTLSPSLDSILRTKDSEVRYLS